MYTVARVLPKLFDSPFPSDVAKLFDGIVARQLQYLDTSQGTSIEASRVLPVVSRYIFPRVTRD